MIGTHHHNRAYVDAVDAERRAAGAHEIERLVHAAAGGEGQAWESLVRRFTRRLTRIVRAHRVASADVDDIVQITFVRLYEQIHTLRDPRALPAWLDTTARRESLRHLRRAARERPLSTDVFETLPAPAELEPASVDAELSAVLQAALERLSPRQRSLLLALFAEDAPSYDEIASVLGIPIGSIGPTRGRALERLRADGHLVALAAEYLRVDADDASDTERAWASSAF